MLEQQEAGPHSDREGPQRDEERRHRPSGPRPGPGDPQRCRRTHQRPDQHEQALDGTRAPPGELPPRWGSPVHRIAGLRSMSPSRRRSRSLGAGDRARRPRLSRIGLLGVAAAQHDEDLAQAGQGLSARIPQVADPLGGGPRIGDRPCGQRVGLADHVGDPVGDHVVHLAGDAGPLVGAGPVGQQVLLALQQGKYRGRNGPRACRAGRAHGHDRRGEARRDRPEQVRLPGPAPVDLVDEEQGRDAQPLAGCA
ncbi:hypothetical protein SGRIM128S_06375 [Streptomyces griseomycini]